MHTRGSESLESPQAAEALSLRRVQVAPAAERRIAAGRFSSPNREPVLALARSSIVELQRTAGNRAVVQLIADLQTGDGSPVVQPMMFSAGRRIDTLQRQQSDVTGTIDTGSYDAGYNAGRAGNEPNPGPLDPANLAAYNQGYEDGHREAERTQTSASSPQTPPIDTAPPEPLPMPGLLSWTPAKGQQAPDSQTTPPQHKGPASEGSAANQGPTTTVLTPVDEAAYNLGVADATKGVPPDVGRVAELPGIGTEHFRYQQDYMRGYMEATAGAYYYQGPEVRPAPKQEGGEQGEGEELRDELREELRHEPPPEWLEIPELVE